ncbi:alpha/beta hydrolase [Vibrio gallaecicus]|uniref:alpha/beta hydrolase n=1 Tax=Vibrio gallaecicus TaxID=552386 RepID=UPI0010C96385|nr:alpha/beta hydrolase [Vibrio gallaecicus]MDN3616878.1 alpha/beta hydrolase [Vibrio gallaecicus]
MLITREKSLSFNALRLSLRVIVIPLLLLPSLVLAAAYETCPQSHDFLQPMFGVTQLKPITIASSASPFTANNQNSRNHPVLWITEHTEGNFKIDEQGGLPFTVIAIKCRQLTESLLVALKSSRDLVGSSIYLSPRTHYVNDLGLSFDQIAQIHHTAFESAQKAQPEELYETIGELAHHLESSPKFTSRSINDNQFHIQTVYYATTRQPELTDESVYYNGKRDLEKPLHVGKADVSIPRDHKKGEIEQPFLTLKWLKQADSHILIQDITEYSPDQFWSELPVELATGEWEKSIIVYIHGYNVAFQSAIKRTAQMAYDFKFSGVPILFSWPSNASLLDYASDREDAMWSATHFAQFMTELKSKHGDANIHIVAHSMGNQVLLNGLNELALQSVNDSTMKPSIFKSVILAAPDVDSEWFTHQIAPRIMSLADNWAIYTSENDGALLASEKVNQVQRLGMPVSLVDGFDIIDTSELNAAPWSIPESHSYYANKLPVIEDLVSHLRGISPEERDLQLIENQTGHFWMLLDSEAQ